MFLELGTLGLATGLLDALYRHCLKEVGRLELNQRTISLPNLPDGLQDLKVLHLSDLHFQSEVIPDPQVLNKILNIEPDLIVITGDLIEYDSGIEHCLKFISQLKHKYGIYVTLGNHDYYVYQLSDLVLRRTQARQPNDTYRLLSGLKNIGATILRNQSLELEIKGERVWIVGINDPITLKDDLDGSIRPIPPAAFRIMASHSADIMLKRNGHRIDMCLAGHCHGGQIKLPYLGELVTHSYLARGSVAGTFLIDETPTHISRGVGVSGWMPLRFNCPPEASLLILKKGKLDLPLAKWKKKPRRT